MQLTKPTESLLNVTAPTGYSFGPHAAIHVNPHAGTVTFGWHSPAGYGGNGLSFTGGLLQPSEDHKYNEITLPLSGLDAITAQAKHLCISLTREIETPEYLAAVEAERLDQEATKAAALAALPAQALAQLAISRDAQVADEDGELADARNWGVLTLAISRCKGRSYSISNLREKTDEEILDLLTA